MKSNPADFIRRINRELGVGQDTVCMARRPTPDDLPVSLRKDAGEWLRYWLRILRTSHGQFHTAAGMEVIRLEGERWKYQIRIGYLEFLESRLS